ncbi:MAG TPA: TonB-dependent receptor plug domain-containing protein, partial [Longimicrobiales bacterium]|nr:TonB-dependent receptor plug domain-containing protein [Longimicrobiales bacterium]
HVLETGTRRPVMLARVALVDTTYAMVDETLSEEDGAFILQAPGPGDYWVVADRVGYRPKMDGILELGEDGWITIEFFLPLQPIELEGITATAERQFARAKLETMGFYDREERGFGHFIDPEEIDNRPVTRPVDLLRGIPRVLVAEDPLAGSTVLFRGGLQGTCSPRIIVDNVEIMGGLALEDAVAVEDIVGIEVYVGVAAAPAEYLMNSNCGVLLIWTG